MTRRVMILQPGLNIQYRYVSRRSCISLSGNCTGNRVPSDILCLITTDKTTNDRNKGAGPLTKQCLRHGHSQMYIAWTVYCYDISVFTEPVHDPLIAACIMPNRNIDLDPRHCVSKVEFNIVEDAGGTVVYFGQRYGGLLLG